MKSILLFLFFSLFAAASFGQAPFMLSGRVVSPERLPLAGATIRLSGGEAGTHAGRDGYFKLVVPERAGLLHISFLGYVSRDISVADSAGLSLIILQPETNVMKEVIVSSGYQQLDRNRTTGSYAEVGQAQLEREVSTDIISRLDGITPALAFDNRSGQGAALSVRGRSTILSDNSPLIVVDNFPYEGDIHDLNPNDVENITVLKDAAAAAIWGARAGNGVIVITTKHGKFNEPTHIAFNTSWTTGAKPNLFYSPEFLNSADFIAVEQQLYAQGYYASAIAAGTVLSPVVDLLNQQSNGLITPESAAAQINAFKQQDVRRDFEKYFYRRSLNQQYSLSLDGGGEQYNYLVSGGYDDDRGSLVGNSDNRYTFHAVNNFRPVKALTIGTDINYTATRTVTNNPGYNALNSGSGTAALYPYAQLADAQGNALAVAKDYPLSYTDGAPGQGFLDWQYRPLQEIGLADNVTLAKDIRLKFNAKYTILPGFNAEALYQYEYSSSEGNFLYSQDTYYTRNLINEFEQPGGQYPVPPGGILHTTATGLASQSGRFQLNYNKLFAGVSQFTAVAGAEVRNTRTQGSSNALYGYNPDILVNQPVDYLTYFNLNPAAGGNSSTVPYLADLSDRSDRYVSEYVNANYNYAQRYYLSASARKDASNLFGVNANQRGVPLYSAGAAWEMNREAFYHLDWLPYLKLRATFGYTGNVNKSITAYTTALYDNDLLTHLPDAQIVTPPNPDLQWEKVRTINLGLDFETTGRRISGSLEYFNKQGTDQLGSVALDPTTGFFVSNRFSYFLNSSAIAGHGADIELNAVNLKGAFGWQTRFLFSYAVDKVTGYQFQNPVSDYLAPDSPPLLGRPVSGIYSYRWAGLDHLTGDPMVYLGGVPTKDYDAVAATATVKDLVYNGPALPPVFGSLMNTFTFRRFTLSANITYKFGYYFHRPSIAYSNLINNWQGNADFAKRWQKPGDELFTQVPSLSLSGDVSRDNAYNYSSILVDKGDNIRLQDIQLSYRFEGGKNARFPFKDLTIYGYASNLGIIWRANRDGLDPDYVYGTTLTKPVLTISLGIRAHL